MYDHLVHTQGVGLRSHLLNPLSSMCFGVSNVVRCADVDKNVAVGSLRFITIQQPVEDHRLKLNNLQEDIPGREPGPEPVFRNY